MTSPAYDMGYLFGQIAAIVIGLTILIGTPILFIASVCLAVIKKSKVWTVLSVIFAIPIVIVVVFFGIGFFQGFY